MRPATTLTLGLLLLLILVAGTSPCSGSDRV